MPPSDKPSNTGELRENGRQQVLDTIRAHGSIARIDIARETGVSPATVTAITSELLAAGKIEEISPQLDPRRNAAEKPSGRRGRPSVALKIRGDAHKIAGLKVGRQSISVLVLDFEGKDLVQHEMPLSHGRMEPADLCRQIVTALEQTCAAGGFAISEISCLGVGVAGLVDAPRNFVYWSSSLTRRNVELGEELTALLHCPVFVENDANLVAKAEHLFGEGRDHSDFVVITVEHGVGMGVVVNNVIYRGTRGCGTEFGHTKVQHAGALCQCGQRGCLEAYVGDYAILREASLLMEDRTDRTVEHLLAEARAGEPLALSIFDRAGRMFAMGLANIINIFDPQLVLISGSRKGLDYLVSENVMEEMRNSVVQVDAPLPEVRLHEWGDLMWTKGAAAYAIEKITSRMVKELSQNED